MQIFNISKIQSSSTKDIILASVKRLNARFQTQVAL